MFMLTHLAGFGAYADSAVPSVVTQYSLQADSVGTAGNFMAKDWTLRGSNDGVVGTADVLDTQTGITWTDSQKRTYSITTTKKYRYFHLHVTLNGNGSTMLLGEMELLNVSSVDQIPVMSAATTSGVTITADSESAGQEAWRMGDGALGSGFRWDSSTTPTVGSPHYATIDFGAAI